MLPGTSGAPTGITMMCVSREGHTLPITVHLITANSSDLLDAETIQIRHLVTKDNNLPSECVLKVMVYPTMYLMLNNRRTPAVATAGVLLLFNIRYIVG